MKLRLIVVLLSLIACVDGKGKYPESSLQCYSSLTVPNFKLICPEARNDYCIKQVSSLTQNLCGATQYFGDLYKNKECQFKACADKCTPGVSTFEFQGKSYTRTTYCCSTDYCNSASSQMGRVLVLAVLAVLMCVFLSY